jgi:hypothetical protein
MVMETLKIAGVIVAVVIVGALFVLGAACLMIDDSEEETYETLP